MTEAKTIYDKIWDTHLVADKDEHGKEIDGSKKVHEKKVPLGRQSHKASPPALETEGTFSIFEFPCVLGGSEPGVR